jgi:hypothetical protein
MVPIILTLQVITVGGHLATHPTHLRVVLSDYLIARLQRMQRIVKRNKFDLISEYNGEPQYLIKDGIYKNYRYGIEAETINVKSTHFYWQGNLVQSDTSVKSSGFFFEDLNKILKIRNLPLTEMPKYINDKNNIIQYLAKIRMESND